MNKKLNIYRKFRKESTTKIIDPTSLTLKFTFEVILILFGLVLDILVIVQYINRDQKVYAFIYFINFYIAFFSFMLCFGSIITYIFYHYLYLLSLHISFTSLIFIKPIIDSYYVLTY